MANYNITLQTNNTDLQAILNKVNALPEAGSSGSSNGGFPNGTEWTQSNITSNNFGTIYNANGIWVAGSGNGYGLCYSTDGKTWTRSNITAGYFYALYNANDIWVTGCNRYYGLYYSVTWEPTT